MFSQLKPSQRSRCSIRLRFISLADHTKWADKQENLADPKFSAGRSGDVE